MVEFLSFVCLFILAAPILEFVGGLFTDLGDRPPPQVKEKERSEADHKEDMDRMLVRGQLWKG